MNKINLRYLFLYVLMAVFITPAEAQTSAGSNIASRTRLLSDGTRKVEQRVYDNGLNTYDYGARQYYSVLGRWDRVDPLCEKYYSTSPYTYCRNNPILRIDPDGQEDYEIDQEGYIQNTTSWIDKIKAFLGYGRDDDRIFMKGNDDPLLTFPQGTVINMNNGNNYSKLEIKDAELAEKAFQTIMSNSDVEWANIRHNMNGDGSNTIVNNHNDRNVDSAAQIAKEYKNAGVIIELFEHSHPVPKDLKYGTNLPFSINVSGQNGMPGDIQTAKGYPGTIFRVFDLHQNRIQYYNGNGVYKTEPWKKK